MEHTRFFMESTTQLSQLNYHLTPTQEQPSEWKSKMFFEKKTEMFLPAG